MPWINKKSGIYQITCIDNGKIYIGSSLSILYRICTHKNYLERNKHRNKYLQASWNKYGKNSFKFEIIEECDPDKRLEREQFWIDIKKPYIRTIGFNMQRSVTDTKYSSKHYIVTFHDGSEKIVYNMAKFCRDMGLDTSSVGKVLSGKNGSHKGFKFRHISQTKSEWEKSFVEKRKMGGGWKFGWIIMPLDGPEFFVQSLKKFCRDNNIIFTALARSAHGKQKIHKGLSCRKSTMTKEEWQEMYVNKKIVKKEGIKKPKKYWILETPDGKEIVIDNLAEFCRDNDLDAKIMGMIQNYKNRQHRGYKCRRVVENDELCII